MVKKASIVVILILATTMMNLANVLTDSTTITRKSNIGQLKILTWNIYMLPHCSLVHKNCMRARIIANQLCFSDFDLIVFEEAFDTRARWILQRKLRNAYPYMYGPANMPLLPVRTNSGVWVVSKIPLTLIDQIEFTHKFGIDAMARKGAVMFEGNWKGQDFQLVCTHLQANSPDNIRREQCKEIALRLLSKNTKANVPQILCGDFNIQSDDPENYQYMLHTLDAENGTIDGDINTSFDEIDNTLARKANGKKQMIDYVLVRNGSLFNNIHRKISVLRASGNNRIKDLSDHYGVEALVEFPNVRNYIFSKENIGMLKH